MKQILTRLALAMIATTCVAAPPLRFQSDSKQVALLELYTSEGCSSCPPAEDWLNRLSDSPGLWKRFVPMAFHVDYWDSTGWKDRLSSPEYSERQRAYAQLWRAENIYTPCFILNGTEWHGWLMHHDVSAAGDPDAGVLEVTALGTNLWSATFAPATAATGTFEIHAALLSGGVDSDVKGGENSGRRLHHEFGVLDLVNIGMATRNGVAHGKFIVDELHHASKKSLGLAVWVTRPGELTPLQATGGWLAQPEANR